MPANPSADRCQCCGITTSDVPVCRACLALPVLSAIQLTRATATIDANAAHLTATATKQGKREQHIARKLAQYAEHGKRCTSCHGAKPAAEYGVCVSRPDGLQTECKLCINTRNALTRSNPAAGRAMWINVRDTLRAQASATVTK